MVASAPAEILAERSSSDRPSMAGMSAWHLERRGEHSVRRSALLRLVPSLRWAAARFCRVSNRPMPMAPVNDHSRSEIPTVSYAASSSIDAFELVARISASPVPLCSGTWALLEMVLSGERSSVKPRVQLSVASQSRLALKSVTVPPRSSKAAPAGAGVGASRVICAVALTVHCSPTSMLAAIKFDRLPERGFCGVLWVPEGLISSLTLLAREEVAASSARANAATRMRDPLPTRYSHAMVAGGLEDTS